MEYKDKAAMRDIIFYFSKKYKNWDSVYLAIKKKEKLDSFDLENLISNNLEQLKNYLCIIDPNYLDSLKTIYMPPMTLFGNGKINLNDLSKDNLNVISILGEINDFDFNKFTQNDVIVLSYTDNWKHINKLLDSGLNIMLLSANGASECDIKKLKQSNISIVSELSKGENYDNNFSDKDFNLIKSISELRLGLFISNKENVYFADKNQINNNLKEFFKIKNIGNEEMVSAESVHSDVKEFIESNEIKNFEEYVFCEKESESLKLDSQKPN